MKLCQSCQIELETDFGIVICMRCGYQNVLSDEAQVLDVIPSDPEEIFVVPISSSGDHLQNQERPHPNFDEEGISRLLESEFSQEHVTISSGLMRDRESSAKINLPTDRFDAAEDDRVSVEAKDQNQKHELLEPFADLDQYFGSEVVEKEGIQSALEELVDFGNSDLIIGAPALFNILIFEINLKEEREFVLEIINKNHIEEAQIEMKWHRGEIEIRKLSAARIARIVKGLGRQDVQYSVTQVPI